MAMNLLKLVICFSMVVTRVINNVNQIRLIILLNGHKSFGKINFISYLFAIKVLINNFRSSRLAIR